MSAVCLDRTAFNARSQVACAGVPPDAHSAKMCCLPPSAMTSIEARPEAAICARLQEMYAFTLACYNAGIERIDLHKKMMAQPPWDTGARCSLSREPYVVSTMQHSVLRPVCMCCDCCYCFSVGTWTGVPTQPTKPTQWYR